VVDNSIIYGMPVQDSFLNNSSFNQTIIGSVADSDTMIPLISSNDVFAGYMDESAVADKLMS
jgi:hypothetical protein